MRQTGPRRTGSATQYARSVIGDGTVNQTRLPEQVKCPSSGEPSSNSGKVIDMSKTLSLNWRNVPRTLGAAAMVLLIVAGVQASALNRVRLRQYRPHSP